MKKIKDYPNYKIDSQGNVYNKNNKIMKPQERKGYLHVKFGLGERGKHKNFRIHRIVASVFIPNPENKPFVNHKNGVKTDNRVENLEWCTQKENISHAYAMNLMDKSGSRNGRSKLEERDIPVILRKLRTMKGKDIAKEYGVHEMTISHIKNGKSWSKGRLNDFREK